MSHKEIKVDLNLFELKKQKPKSKKTLSKKDLVSMISTGDSLEDLERITDTPKEKEKEKKPKSILKNNTVKHTFGKKNNTVKIFIKDKDEYSKIESDKKKLMKHSMTQVRQYLKTRRLYQVGSSAPDELLRDMYVNSHLTGHVENINSKNLIQEFMNEN
jgi:hypothetical protein